jgi:hypothetical protein
MALPSFHRSHILFDGLLARLHRLDVVRFALPQRAGLRWQESVAHLKGVM